MFSYQMHRVNLNLNSHFRTCGFWKRSWGGFWRAKWMSQSKLTIPSTRLQKSRTAELWKFMSQHVFSKFLLKEVDAEGFSLGQKRGYSANDADRQATTWHAGSGAKVAVQKKKVSRSSFRKWSCCSFSHAKIISGFDHAFARPDWTRDKNRINI